MFGFSRVVMMRSFFPHPAFLPSCFGTSLYESSSLSLVQLGDPR